MLDWFSHPDMLQWVATLGYVGVGLIVLLEMGFFLAFFLPGDSLVFTAGLLASQGIFNIYYLVTLLFFTATAAYFFAYWFGETMGHLLLKRKESFFFKAAYLEKAKHFYIQHGGKALVIGRLLPIVRTFLPIVAGMAQMPYARYCFFNILGAIVWGIGVTLLGYFLGGLFPNLVDYMFPIILLIIGVSLLPGVICWLHARIKRGASS